MGKGCTCLFFQVYTLLIFPRRKYFLQESFKECKPKNAFLLECMWRVDGIKTSSANKASV
jgi:hypothetical protein